MASKNVQGRLREQLIAAEKRLAGLETEAQKVVNEVGTKIRVARGEVQDVLKKAQEADFADRAEELKKRLDGVTDEVAKRVNTFHARAFERLGIARREEVNRLGKDISKLARKLEKMSQQLSLQPAAKKSTAKKRPIRNGV